MAAARTLGRYARYDEIAHGGMATVYLGRVGGPAGFSRIVALKCLHPHLARDASFVNMFLDEARLAARVRHANVVSVLDVLADEGELVLVMDYVHGLPLLRLMTDETGKRVAVPPPLAAAVAVDLLRGLAAAHEAMDENGAPLCVVHRDVSPQNVLVGTDGVARVLDFGIAKAIGRLAMTGQGQIKGKLSYMAPEQFRAGAVTHKADLYAAGVVLWEALTGRHLFGGAEEAVVLERVLLGVVHPPSKYARHLGAEVDDVVLRALSRDPDKRFADAAEMAAALGRAIAPASAEEVSAWVTRVGAAELEARARLIADAERARVQAPGARARPSWRLGLALAGAAAASAALTSVVFGRAGKGAHDAPRADTHLEADAPPAPQHEDPHAASAAAPTAADTARAAADPPPSARQGGTRRQAGSRKVRRLECTPPYTTDPATGRIHWKLDCLE